MVQVHLPADVPGRDRLAYVWALLARNKRIEVAVRDTEPRGALTVSSASDADVWVSPEFHARLDAGEFGHETHLKDDLRVRSADGRVDWLATIYYLVNSVQEWGEASVDELGRYAFAGSLQHRFGCIERNVVQEVIDEFLGTVPALARFVDHRRRSRVFLTHDIDTVYDAYRQDGLAALRRGDVGRLLQLLWNAAVGKPDWLNMDRILAIESEYDVKSVFYWLVSKGRVNDRVTNADYSIDDPRVREQVALVADRGWENGLHKSVSEKSFTEELSELGFAARGNRYHYLKFKPPEGYEELEASGLELDCTLGFAEAPGFRNGYGLPFAPYSETNRRAHSFVEAPLHFMDGSFQRYLGAGPAETEAFILRVLEANPNDCVFTFLWHNTFFADGKFRGYLGVYKRVLAFVREAGYRSMTEREIIDEFRMP